MCKLHVEASFELSAASRSIRGGLKNTKPQANAKPKQQ